jgi:alpha-D-ribose 1-methylphosphonate 5-triphosphate synthase subunit PhnH
VTQAGVDHLAETGRGFADPVHATQRVFRGALGALSHPGRIQTLPDAALRGLQAPGSQLALWALLLTLLDVETRLWLHPALGGHGATAWLRFHTGTSLAQDPADADFAALPGRQAEASLWTRLAAGSDEAPQDGATLLVEVDGLHACDRPGALRLTGPGIEHQQWLCVPGLGADFWSARQVLQGDYPRGVDLLLCCGSQLAGLPRTTRVEWGG